MKIATRSRISVALGLAAAVCVLAASLYSVDDWPVAPRNVVLFFGLAALLIALAAKISPGRGLRTSTPVEDPEKTVVLTSDRVGPGASERRED